MKISDQVALATKNLSRRKGRTALTVIGVVVGTCAVIVMISLGIATNKSYDEMLQSWGDLTQIQVYGGNTGVAYSIGGVTTSSSTPDEPAKLNDETLKTIRALDHVVAATPYYEAYSLNGRITAGRGDRYQVTYLGNLIGIDPASMEPMGFTLTSGDWLSATAKYGKDTLPVLVGEGAGYNFEDTRRSQNSPKRYRWQGQTDANGNPLKPFVDINKDEMTLTLSDGDPDNPKEISWKLEVVGVLTPDTAKGYWTQSGIVLRLNDMKMLLEEYKKLSKNSYVPSTEEYNQVYVKVDDLKNVESTDKAIQELGFSTYSMTQQREAMQEQVRRNQLMLGGLAAISLFVAALNIANTMTMAIYERTREIGVMKVLGCELGNIRRMFLIESGCIGFIGGVIGAVLSLGISAILNNITLIMSLFSGLTGSAGGMGYDMGMMGMMGMGGTVISVIPPWLVLAALAFATAIGLLSGLAPASRAVKISALEAIRHD